MLSHGTVGALVRYAVPFFVSTPLTKLSGTQAGFIAETIVLNSDRQVSRQVAATSGTVFALADRLGKSKRAESNNRFFLADMGELTQLARLKSWQ